MGYEPGVGYRAGWDTMLDGIRCLVRIPYRVGYRAGVDTVQDEICRNGVLLSAF